MNISNTVREIAAQAWVEILLIKPDLTTSDTGWMSLPRTGSAARPSDKVAMYQPPLQIREFDVCWGAVYLFIHHVICLFVLGPVNRLRIYSGYAGDGTTA